MERPMLRSFTMRTPYAIGLGLLIAGIVSAQEHSQLKARELFYTPIPDAKPAKEVSEKETPKAATVKPVKPKPAQPATDSGDTSYQAARKSPRARGSRTRRMQTLKL